MNRRHLPLAPRVATLAAALYPFWGSVQPLGAQVAPPPPRPARVATPAPPRPAPTPAPTPAAAPMPRVWFPEHALDIDRIAINAARMGLDASRAAMLEARTAVAPLIDMSEIRAQIAEARVSMEHLRDAWTPMAPIAPMAPMLHPAFESGFDQDIHGTAARSNWTRTLPPASWKSDDPADSLYSQARKALSSDSYRRAAELFRRIRDQYPKSTYTPDAPYWEAFALQRIGGESDLRAAQEALTWQAKQYPKAATRGDAAALSTRIDAALARRGDQQAYRDLMTRVNGAESQGCPRENDDERVTALNALARMDTAQIVPVLRKVLARREACTQALRRTAVWLYASRKVADAPQVLMNVARTDPDREVREQAVFWMANVPTEEAAGMLIELAKGNGEMDLRKRAVYALSKSKSPRATATLREIATDASTPTELRKDALQWYMSGPARQAEDAMAFLRDVYGKADDQDFRNRVLQIIGSRKSDEAREFLTGVAQNSRESIDTRRQALSALQSAGATPAQLASIYDRSTNDIEVRRMAISLLASLRDNAGVDKLLDVARNEKNLELRKAAVSYLSRTKDPRAMQLLQEIILK